MTKLLVRFAIALIVLLILGVVGVVLSLDSAIKRGVETIGPKITQVDVKLDSVSLSLLSGAGKLKGLVVGNPPGYKTPSAISVGQASLTLQPSSVLSSKVVIRSIEVQAPEITFESDLKGNNLNKILSNLQASTGGGGASAPAEAQAGKKLQVDDFRITGGQVHVNINALGNQASATVALPEIHLSGLGQGPEGITAAELTKLALQAIEKEAVQLAGSGLSIYGRNLSGLTKGLGGTNTADQVTKGLEGLLKKKK